MDIPPILPEYCRLFEIEKKKKDGTWISEEAEEMYTKLVQLHYDEVDDKGEDKLTVQEAYTRVLGKKSGYQCGLGPGALPLATIEKNEQMVRERVEMQNTMLKDIEAKMREQITQELEEKFAQKEKEREEKQAQREKEIEERVKAGILASLKSAG